MEMKVVDKKKNIEINLTDSDVGFANALRRTMYNEIPIVAVDYVNFEINNSGMADEMIAHRLSMVPLKFDPDTYSEKVETVLVIDKKGPCMVKSGDMKSTDKDVAPVDGNVPIMELLEGQELKLEAVTGVGIGKQHSKWQASIVGYEAKDDKNFKMVVESVCGLEPRKVLQLALDKIEEETKDFISKI